MGRKHRVPAGLTILQAMEFSGYTLVRGVGCRGGVCGACSAAYRLADDYHLKSGLACQTVVEDGMELVQLPFFPGNKAVYEVEAITPDESTLREFYPEIARCMGCNSCTLICPQNLEVMEYMSAALRGDVAKVAELSFECILCRLCATRCPADEVQPFVAILARRLYGRHLAPPSPHLAQRVAEIKEGTFEAGLGEMKEKSKDELTEMYKARDIEPQ
ncbi:MAG: 4Fe-4S dicluster domain-containing protein [Candidatus Coatesbacteria bacterium]|nr:MAG: 4Fe-4S dicluster domain-containing protein [Candidatus Coatesbacteria bacterium]